MKKFCGKCGSKLDPETGLCPKCDSKTLKEIKGSKKAGHLYKWVLLGILCIVIIAIGTCGLKYFGGFNIPGTDWIPCPHEWQDAACTTPKTCMRCGATEGKIPGHKWKQASCTAPLTCTQCGKTAGDALDHKWQDATCTQAQTCIRCEEIKGTPLGHAPGERKAEIGSQASELLYNQYCSRCGTLLDSTAEPITPLVADGKFICTPREFLERFILCAMETSKDASWEIEEFCNTILGEFSLDAQCSAWVCFFDNPLSLSRKTDVDSSGFYCASITFTSRANSVDLDYAADFCMACGAPEETAEALIQAGEDAMAQGREIAFYAGDGLIYEVTIYPSESIYPPYRSVLTIAVHPDSAVGGTSAGSSQNAGANLPVHLSAAAAEAFLPYIGYFDPAQEPLYRTDLCYLADFDEDGEAELLVNYPGTTEEGIPTWEFSILDYEAGTVHFRKDAEVLGYQQAGSNGYGGIVFYQGKAMPATRVYVGLDGTGWGTTAEYTITVYDGKTYEPVQTFTYWDKWVDPHEMTYFLDGEEVSFNVFKEQASLYDGMNTGSRGLGITILGITRRDMKELLLSIAGTADTLN